MLIMSACASQNLPCAELQSVHERPYLIIVYVGHTLASGAMTLYLSACIVDAKLSHAYIVTNGSARYI